MTDSGESAKTSSMDDHDPCQELVTLMAALENRIVLYPPEHDSIRRVTDALRLQTEALLEHCQTLVLSAAQDRLLLNGRQLAAGSPRNRKFALLLSQRGIVSVTIERGVTTQALIRFFELLHMLPPKTDLCQLPSLERELGALPHISITRLELDALRVENKAQVEAPVDTDLSENRWERLILSSAAGAEDTDLLRAIYALLPELTAALPGDPAAQPPVDAQPATVTELLEVLQNQLPREMIMAMGVHALNDNRQISPALRKLISTISLIQKDLPGALPARSAGAIGADSIQKLFERERFEDYVSPEYNAQLDALAQTGENLDADAPGERLSGFQEAELQEEQVSRWLAKSLLGLLGEPYEDDIRRGCADQLGIMLPEFLERKEYDFLRTIYLELTRIEAQDGGAASAQVRALLDSYSGDEFVDRLNRDYSGPSEDTYAVLEELILISGPRNIPWLLDLYNQGEDNRRRARVLQLLLMFKSAAAEAALDRLSTLDLKMIKPVLRLITLCGGDPADARLLPLLETSDPDVFLEVVRILLTAGSPAPLSKLTGMIRSGDLATSVRAIRLAGEFKVSALASELVRQLRTVYISDAGAFRNRYILESLNQIGDVSVLPSLLKLAKTRVSFTPGRLRATQQILSMNITGYPDHSIKWRLESGPASKEGAESPP